MEEREIGVVSTYFKNVGVAAIRLLGGIKIGQKLHIRGHTTDFIVEVDEIQINRKQVSEGEKGDHIGILVPEKVRPKDKVFLVKES